ncbi:cyclase family protein [Amycolatopsis sp. NPDC051372]|uniref:cyclase family protein n=1 Tax=unclassified Amycolatopsis TaxID=2618356 RepID=UPI003448F264
MTDEVPAVAHLLAGAPRNWGRWGEDDEVGTLNPSSPARAAPRRYMVQDQGSWYGPEPPDLPGGARYADDVVVSHLQGSTQYDALGHVWYDDTLYNGYDAATTIGGLRKASVLPIAERGVVGRGVLVDLAGFRGKRHLDRDETFTHEDLTAAAAAQGVEIRPHDVLLINTGWLEFFYSVPREEFFGESYQEPGLIYTPELAEWFQAMEIANLATDTIGNEVLIDPPQRHHVARPLCADAQPRLGVHRDLRPARAGRRLPCRRPVGLPLRGGTAEGGGRDGVAGDPIVVK